MNELRAILDGLAGAGRQGESAVLATVVGVTGSAYRRPGARLLLLPDSRGVGAISGGCLEGDVADRALRRDAPADPFVVRYDSTADEEIAWELGLGCGGVVDVLIERIDPARRPAFVDFLVGRLEGQRAGVLSRVVGVAGSSRISVGAWLALSPDGEASEQLTAPDLAGRLRRDAADVLRRGRSRRVVYDEAFGRVDVFHELLRPPPSLLLCGAGYDAPPVARLAAELGWRVTVCDRLPDRVTAERFPTADELIVCRPPDLLRRHTPEAGAAAVVMTHDYADDQCFLESLLPLPLRYIGVLGSRRRTDSLLRALATRRRPARLHGPVGLDLGAETPQEIALAIVAEVQAVLAGRNAGFLRDRPGPIHERGPTEEKTPSGRRRAARPVCPLRAE